jgi:hypothetical protein
MPPHSSHLLKLLDVSCFAILKQSYGRQIEGYIRNGVNHIDKLDFLEVYHTARIEAMTLANVQSSFAAIGLMPFDPERVFSKLHTQLKTPTPPSTSHANAPTQPWAFKTPHVTTQLEPQAKAIKDDIKNPTAYAHLPTPTNRPLN